MAKVKGPLFSVGASGKIADTLVYFPWKGLEVVRQWLVPADPKTPAQKTQRGHLRDAVMEWHGARYNQFDREAWRRFATHDPDVMTGFNRMVKSFLLTRVRMAKAWQRLHMALTDTVTTSGFRVQIDATTPADAAPTIHWGLTPGTLLNSAPMTGVGVAPFTQWEYTITGLLSRTIYYFQIDFEDPATFGETGIYDERTA